MRPDISPMDAASQYLANQVGTSFIGSRIGYWTRDAPVSRSIQTIEIMSWYATLGGLHDHCVSVIFWYMQLRHDDSKFEIAQRSA